MNQNQQPPPAPKKSKPVNLDTIQSYIQLNPKKLDFSNEIIEEIDNIRIHLTNLYTQKLPFDSQTQ